MASGAERVSDEMFFAAATALSEQVTQEDLAADRIYPALDRIRKVSTAIAVAVAEVAYRNEIARHPRPSSTSRPDAPKEGDSEGDPYCGRGWAVIENEKETSVHLFIHGSDDS